MPEASEILRSAAACEKITLDNGLTLLVCPMEGTSGVHAIYGTRFGSIDREFILNGQTVSLPAGVAHFLEHKMFESEKGDAFTLYAKTGANANAYTSFDKTCYVFTASDNIDENLDILLDFVSHPRFTEQTVAKEQGIIGQEIKMYEDAPDWRLMFALLESLYHTHPVRDDIAGSVQSIAGITPQMLYQCTDAFYCPQNMALCVAGNITVQTVLDAVQRAQIPAKPLTVQRISAQEKQGVAQAYRHITMQVASPLLGVGFKAQPLAQDDIAAEFAADMLGELVVGSCTPLYRRLYDEGLVAGDFSAEYISLDNCLCIMFCGEVTDPETVRGLLLDEIARIRAEGVDETLFTLCKNMMYGEMVADLDSHTSVAQGQLGAFFKGRTLADEIAALAALSPQQVNAAFCSMLNIDDCATVIIDAPAEE